MVGLLIFGSFWFWALISTVFIFTFFLVEAEKPGWATITLTGTFVALALLGDFNLWHVVLGNPIGAAIAGGVYFLSGAVWSVGKWWFYVKDMYSRYQRAREEFMHDNSMTSADIMNATLKSKWAMNYEAKACAKPEIRRHKGRITMWMMYWPWSMVWTVINDPVKKIFSAIFHELQGLYQRIADSVYKNAERDV